MTDDIVGFGISVEATDLDKASKKFDRLGDSSVSAERKIDRSTKAIKNDLDGVRKSTHEVSRASDGLNKNVSTMGNRFITASRAVKAFAAALAVREVARYASEIAKVADESARLNSRLVAVTGSQQNATEAMRFLTDMAQRQSISIVELSDAYTRILPAVKSGNVSLQEMRTTLSLVNDNIAAFGLSSSTASGLFFGLSQLMTSGTVTMEDLRQVTDRLPGSFDGIARSMGLTTKGLRDLISKGQVTIDDILTPLNKVLKENEGSAENLGKSLQAASVRLSNSFNNLKISIGESTNLVPFLSKATDFLAENLQEVSDEINIMDGNFKKLSTKAITREIKDLSDEISILETMIEDLNGGGNFAEGILDFITSGSSTKSRLKDLTLEIEERQLQIEGLRKQNEENKRETKRVLGENGGGGGGSPDKPDTASARLAQARQERIAEIAIEANEMRMLAEAYAVSAEEGENLSLALERQKEIRSVGKDLTLEEIKSLEEYLTEIQKAEKAIEDLTKQRLEDSKASRQAQLEAERAAEAMLEPYRNAARSLQTTFSNTFESLFTGSITTASDAADAILNIFIRMAAEIATLELIGPSGFDLSSVLSGAGGNSGGSSGLSSLSSLTSLFNTGSSTNLTGTLVGDGIDYLGSSLGLSNSSFIGPMPLGETAPLSGSFNATAGLASMGGNMGANLIFGSDRGYSDIGGTVGGAIGTAVGGPIGGAVGAFAGNLIGGFFGPGRAHPVSNFGTNEGFGESGALEELQLSSKHIGTETAKELSDVLSQYGQQFTSLGFDLSKTGGIQGGVDDGQGFFNIGGGYTQQIEGNYFGFDPNDLDSMNSALNDFFIELIERSGSTGDAMGELSDEFQALADNSTNLDQLIADTQALLNFDSQLASSIQSITDPASVELKALNQEYESLLQEASRLGIETTLTEIWYKERLNELTEKYNQSNEQSINEQIQTVSGLSNQWRNVSAQLGDALFDIQTGSSSFRSSEDRLALLQGEFDRLSESDDPEELARLDDVAREIVSLSDEFYASSQMNTNNLQRIEEVLEQSKAKADGQITVQDNMLLELEKQTALLEQQSSSIITSDRGTFSSGNFNEILIANTDALKANNQYNEALSVLDQYNGNTVAGSGRNSLYFQNNASSNILAIEEARRRGLQGFQSGGFTPVNQDFLVGEQGPEILRLNKSATVTPINSTLKSDSMDSNQDPSSASYERYQIVKSLDRMTQAIDKNNRLLERVVSR